MNHMSLYLYINKNVMFSYLARNSIAPDKIVNDISNNRTVSTASDYFLFVTHKKLGRESRERGILEPEYVCPITLELTGLRSNDGPAILVTHGDDKYHLAKEPLSNYDIEKHVGAYLLGEIPLSRIDRVYFDTQNDMEMFARPSPDYWYPTKMFAVLPNDFSEELYLKLDDDKIIDKYGGNPDDILRGVIRREKKRASILNLVNGTNAWQYGKYIFSIDISLQRLLSLSDMQLADVLPHYLEMKGKNHVENLLLYDRDDDNGRTDFNQLVYDDIYGTLIEQPYNTQKQADTINDILTTIRNKIKDKCEKDSDASVVHRTFEELLNLATDTSSKVPEEILASIPEPLDALKALMFVSKNPNKFELFLESLNAYHADFLTRRRACVLWGALNGLYGMPGEGFNKDNQELWQFIEAVVYSSVKPEEISLSIEMPEVIIVDDKVLGIKLTEERVITVEDVLKVIRSIPMEKSINRYSYKLLEAAEVEYRSKVKVRDKGYTQNVASVSLPEIKAGEVLNASTRKVLEQLIRDSKQYKPNGVKLYTDYIENDAKFNFVYDLDPSYWKREAMKLQEHSHE